MATRNWIVAPLAGLLLAFGCTQDFDAFQIGEASGGAAGIDGGGSGGSAGDASPDVSSDGSGGDAEVDADASDGGCPSGLKRCGTACVAVDDPAFGCGPTSCASCTISNATATCDTQGQCAIDSCNSGYSDCNGMLSDGCEINTNSSPENCGGCGSACVVGNGTAGCTNGSCSVAACDSGYADCDNNPSACEVNTNSDPAHCGSCTKDCSASGPNLICDAGNCVVSMCPSGTGNCDGNTQKGCETNTQTSVDHCGFCANKCNLANATATCTAGSCAIQNCDPGFEDCDNNPLNGCEINLSNNAGNCGACNRACSGAGTTSVSCNMGVCSSTCQAGFSDCSSPPTSQPDDGCEANVTSDIQNCGACARACSNTGVSAKTCSAGRCTSTCVAGRGNCDQPFAPTPDDGCEVNLNSDTSNCGSCNRLCAGTNVSALACQAGLCTSSCQPGFDNCNTPSAPAFDDGCEANVSADVDNCGACGRACSSTNALQRICSAGVCTPICNSPFLDCAQPAAPTADNGCETNPNNSLSHCGGCERSCSTVHVQNRACSGGVCTSTCQAGYGNCSTPAFPDLDEGCESNLNTDVDDCGACGRACSSANVSARFCASGACTSTCTGAFGNCSQPSAPQADDGCEVNLNTNPQNCGTCGRSCAATNALSMGCSAGTCTPYCQQTHVSCTAPATDNGCEKAVATASCGSCDNACAGSLICGNSPEGFRVCGCFGSNSRCGNNASCNGNGQCVCPINETCRPGETCVSFDCSCNGNTKCSGSQVCCQNPAGCFNLSTDPDNCGGCGRACHSGFGCTSGTCTCQTNANCNAGSPGTCNGSGLCVCGGATCGEGERCLSDGSCG